MSKNIKSLIIILLSICLLFTLSACGSSTELGQSLIVEGVAVDMTDDNNYAVTIQVFDAQSAKSDDTSTVDVIYSVGNSVSEAFSNASLQTGKDFLYSQNTILVIGEKTVTQNNLYDFMDFFVRNYQARPDVYVFIARGQGGDILSTKKDDKFIPASSILELGTGGNIKVESTVKQVVGDIKNDTSNPVITALSISDAYNDPTICEDGVAIFNQEDKLAGYLNDEEALGLSVIKGQGKGNSIYVELPNNKSATLNISDVKSDIDFKLIDDKPVYTINVDCDMDLYELDTVNLKENGLNFYDVEQYTDEKIKSICDEAIETTVYKYNSDACNFGKVMLQKDKDYYENCKDNFSGTLTESSFEVNVKSKINITGQEAH